MPDVFGLLDEISGTARSGLRERALKKTLARVEASLTAQLQVRERGLSPLEVELNRQNEMLLKDARARLSDSLSTIRQQNAAEDEAEKRLRKLTPLQRASRREGLFRRSEQDRQAAILGFLERERRARAPLSREARARAQAIAASRGQFDVKSAYRRYAAYAGHPGVSSSFGVGDLRGVDISVDEVDPCVEYKGRQVIRREVMFAQRNAGRGYRGKRYSRSPC